MLILENIHWSSPDGRGILNGEDITSLDVTERAKRGISFAFQQPVRFKGITVRQLLEISAGRGVNDAELCDILGKVGLCARSYMNREVNATLSGGEIKRIEIATVLARHTVLSVFDEPEAGIDLWSFRNLIDVFKGLRGDMKGSMIIISHQERILRIADETVLISNGVVGARGEADEIIRLAGSTGSAQPSCYKEAALQ